MYDLMIIGGGPAGLAAGVYAARQRMSTLLLSRDIGGQMNLTLGIENYLGYQFIESAELISKFQFQMSQFPIEQKIGAGLRGLKSTTGGFEALSEAGDRYQSRAVIFATGKRQRSLNVPGEAEFTGKGVSYCAICDGPIFAGQRVAVIGGGNSALGAALDMVKIASHVSLVSLTPLTGESILIEKLRDAKNLEILTEHRVERIEGKGLITGALVKNLKTGETRRIKVAAIFIEIGMTPNSEPVRGLVQVNDLGEVVVNCLNETSLPGLYAAGDVTTVPEKQILIAAGEGAKAALQAKGYLQRLKA